MKKKRTKGADLDGAYGDLMDQVTFIGRQLYSKWPENPRLARRIERLLDDESLPPAAELEKAKAQFFALPPDERAIIFNGWRTMTPELPPRHNILTSQRILSMEPMPDGTILTSVDWKLRERTVPVEVLIMEGTSFAEALAYVEVCRNLIMRQWREMISSCKVEVRHV